MVPHVEYYLENGQIKSELIYPNDSHNVYFLQSTVSNRTYVGYSPDPYQRLRKHNGFITGGAKRTHYGRPWRIVCIVSGFPDKHTALQFEWEWHDIRASRKRVKNGRGGKRQYRKCPGITTPYEGLQYLFSEQWTSTSSPPFSFPITVFWNMDHNPWPNIRPQIQYSCNQQAENHTCWVVHTGTLQPINNSF